jgi:hypothetical protein
MMTQEVHARPTSRGGCARIGKLAFFALALLALTPADRGAMAASGELQISGIEPAADSQLADMRGGFSIGGHSLSFGVLMRTAINGLLVMETAFNLRDPSDRTTTFTNGGTNIPVVDGTASGGGFTLTETARGYELSNENNTTSVITQIGGGMGILVDIQNSLNGQTIQQTTMLNVGIANLATLQAFNQISTLLGNLNSINIGSGVGF